MQGKEDTLRSSKLRVEDASAPVRRLRFSANDEIVKSKCVISCRTSDGFGL